MRPIKKSWIQTAIGRFVCGEIVAEYRGWASFFLMIRTANCPWRRRCSDLLPAQQTLAPQPILGPLRPGRDQFFRWSQTITMAPGRIHVQLCWNLGVLQCERVMNRVLNSHRIVASHRDERRRCVGCNGNLGRDFVALVLPREPPRV